MLTVASLVLTMMLLKKSFQRTAKIKMIFYYEKPDATYSIFTLCILHVAKFSLCLTILQLLLFSFQLLSFADYQKLFLSDAQVECRPYANTWSHRTLLANFENVLLIGVRLSFDAIYSLQIFEWGAMIYIIQSQRNRNVN